MIVLFSSLSIKTDTEFHFNILVQKNLVTNA